MNIDFDIYSQFSRNSTNWRERFNSRLASWPTLNHIRRKDIEPRGIWLVADKSSFELIISRNFWPISEQYYTLAWSMYTLSFKDQIEIPYQGNISSDQDTQHQHELRNQISRNGWSFTQFLGLAHLSCELGLKSILLHTSIDYGQEIGFPKTHDLHALYSLLNPEIQDDFRQSFAVWGQDNWSPDLEEILAGSGHRFNEQRYGEITSIDQVHAGVLGICRYLHSSLLN